MSAEIRPSGYLEPAQMRDGVLRRPDGSFDIAAYAAMARRQRSAAAVSSMRAAIQFAWEAWSAIAAPRGRAAGRS
jgi:hypothetical protein